MDRKLDEDQPGDPDRMGNPVRREQSRGSKPDDASNASNAADIGKQALAMRLAFANQNLSAPSDEQGEVPRSSEPMSLEDFIRVRPSGRASRGRHPGPHVSERNTEGRPELSGRPRDVPTDILGAETATLPPDLSQYKPFPEVPQPIPERVNLNAEASRSAITSPFDYPSAASSIYTNFIHMKTGELQDVRSCDGMLRYVIHGTGQVSIFKWVYDDLKWQLVGTVSPPYATGIVKQIDALGESAYSLAGPDRTACRDSIEAKVKALKDSDSSVYGKVDRASNIGDYENLSSEFTQMLRHQHSEEIGVTDPISPFAALSTQKDERKATELEKLQKQARDAIRGSLGQYEPFAPAGSQLHTSTNMSGSSFPFRNDYGLHTNHPVTMETPANQEVFGLNNNPVSMPRRGKNRDQDFFPEKPPLPTGQSKFGYLLASQQPTQTQGWQNEPPNPQRRQNQKSEKTPFMHTRNASSKQINSSSNVQAPAESFNHMPAAQRTAQSLDNTPSTTNTNPPYLSMGNPLSKQGLWEESAPLFAELPAAEPEPSPYIGTGSWWALRAAEKQANSQQTAAQQKVAKWREELNRFWYSGIPDRRDQADEDVDLMQPNPIGDPNATTIGPELLIPALESLRQYQHRRVDGKTASGEKPEGVDDSYMRYKSVPEWCIDHSMTRPGSVAGTKSVSLFGEQEWTQTPERVGRDPRYRPFLETRGAGTIGRPSTRNSPSSSSNPGAAFKGHGTPRKQG